MRIIRRPAEMQAVSRKYRNKAKSIGFVPTMGALHEGHLSLIRHARKENDITVVSIFVNPAQFGPKEDFKRYPRPINKDIFLCKKEGVDIIFHPDVKMMYPGDFKTYVTVEGLSGVLCGKSRPGHFRGMATVVIKLFNIVSPDAAYFGQKDAQQTVIIKKMACDLNIPIKIKVIPTLRQKDGLALSSRNLYLSKGERADAFVLYDSLNSAKELIDSGIRDTDKIIKNMRRLICEKNTAKIDYLSIVDLDTLEPVKKITGNTLIALAVWIGKTRLIDNIIVRT